jgi:hypothetical protein
LLVPPESKTMSAAYASPAEVSLLTGPVVAGDSHPQRLAAKLRTASADLCSVMTAAALARWSDDLITGR